MSVSSLSTPPLNAWYVYGHTHAFGRLFAPGAEVKVWNDHPADWCNYIPPRSIAFGMLYGRLAQAYPNSEWPR